MSYHYIYKESKQKGGPLMLMIHGYGSNEQDLFGFKAYLPEEFTIVSVRAPHEIMMGGFAWYDIDFSRGDKFNDMDQANESLEGLNNIIDEVTNRFECDPYNVWLMGFSQGAILSYGLLFQHSDKIKNVIAMSGYIIPDFLPSEPFPSFENKKVFASHGEMDPVIPYELASKIPAILDSLQIDYTFKHYPAGHTVTEQNLKDILTFINQNL